MKKFYPATAVKRNAIVGRFLATTGLIFLLLCQGNRVSAQVSLTASAGTLSGTYTTLKAAFDAINAGTHQGSIAITITGNTTESATAALNSSAIAPASYSSVTITPTANVTVSGNIAGALVKLNGADNVTINGLLAGTRQLTFNNTNASSAAVVMWLACASAADGATNNAIRNCNINGATLTTTLAGIASSGITLGSVAETANANNTYENNSITTAQYGIAVVGPSVMETGTIIRGNLIGSTTAANKIYFRGLFISNQQNISVTQNTIRGVAFASGSGLNQGSGIYVVGAISGGSIDRNSISDVTVVSFWGCNGIQLNSSTANTGLVIANNFIYDIAAGGWTSFDSVDDNGTGIAVNSGGGYNIWYNSINLTTNQSSGITAAIWFSTDVSLATLNIRNNIFANSQTTGTRYSIYSNSANTIFSSINYNDYYTTGAAIGFMLTTSYATLANWQSATGQDANSVNIIPNFTSTTDLHLLGSSALDALGTPIGSITTDYDADVRNATTPDIGADEFTPPNCTGNSGGTASASVTDICASGSSTLSSTGYSFGLGSAYQWEFFNGVSWVSLAGQTNPASANTGTITTTTQYRLRVTCNAGAPGYSNTVTITVNNPTVSSTTPGSRCGVGTVNLAAVGSNLKWYSAATGGTLLGTGSPFTTPVISTTTQFYVSASTTGVSATGGKASTTGPDGGYNGAAGLVFDAFTSFKISSVLMYPQGATTVTIQAQDNTGATLPGCTYTTTFTGATSTGIVVPIDFTIPVGTGHRLVITNNSAGVPIWRDFTGNTYPYALGALGNITGGYIGGSSGTYYFFYNWQVTSACEGIRTAVTATVTAPPAITPSATPATVCGGTNVSLNVTSSNGGYTYVWTPGSLSGAAQTVNPVSSTTYSVTATDASAGPFSGCVNVATVNVTVNATPTNVTVSPAVANVCASPVITQITASGGLISNQTIHQEFFETFPLTQYTVGGSGLSATQNTTYYQSGSSSVYLLQTSTGTMDGDIRMNSSVNLTNYTNPSLSFYHICGLEGAITAFDFGYIEYSTDGGTSWTSFPTSTYSGTATLFNGVVSYSSRSYTDWNAQFSGTNSTPGTGPATALWKKETIDLSSYASQSNFRIRFRVTGDINTVYYGWLIDSVRISGTGQAPITWSPTTDLYTDPGGTISYLGGPATTVYTKPTASRIYTATATGGAGCTKTATANLTVTSIAVGVSIAASPSNNICAGSSVTFTATPTNGGTNPFYKWFVNGSGPVASGIGVNTYTTSTLANGDIVTCTLLSNVGGCATNNPDTSNAITMTVNPIPSVNITGPNTVCNGAPPITLTANASVSPGSISTYQWFLGGVSQGAPSGVNTFSATAAGTYTVTATSAAGCPQTSANFVVTLPTYTITATAGPNGTISPSGAVVVNCGDNQTFTITPNGGFAIQDVLVDGVSQGAIATYTFTNVTAPHTISATFFIAGCANPPTANAGANVSICANQSYTLAGSIGGSATVGTWSGGTGTFTPNNTTLNASYTPSAAEITAGTVTLTLTTNNPNGAPCVVSTSNITITIKEIPVVSISGTLGFCPASTTTLTASATINPTGPITYNWLFNGVTPLNSTATQSSSPAGAGSYQVTATGNGCSNTATVNVVAFTPPSISITGSNVICTNTNTLLTASVTLGSGSISGNTYVWKRGGVTIVGANTSSLSTNTPGTYTVQVTDDNGCASAVSANFVLTNDSSPLNGNYTISSAPASCTNYISFASAVNDLNTRGISGNVRFSVAAGYTETVPSGGLLLGTATLNSSVGANTITFEKSGVGANPLLTAYAGGTFTPATASLDGIFGIRGTDNVTISQIDLNDPNTTNPSTMEFGYGLFKFDATNGTQNVTILNCNITLNKANNTAAGTVTPNGSSGILMINSTAAAANTALTPTGAAGTNSNNKFYGNNIRNCNNGIALIGFAASSPFTLADSNNDIGGTSGLTGNTIEAFGGGGTVQCAGIWINNQWGLNVSYNDLNNTNSSGVAHTGVIRGIYGIVATGASITIGNNNVTLTSASTTSACTGIENAIGSTGAGNTVTISSNTVTVLSGSATTANATAITNSASASTVSINNNIVENCTLTGTGIWTGISNTIPVTSLSMTGNTVQNNNIASTGTTFTPFANTTSTSTGTTTLLMSNNIITNNTKAGSSTAALTVNWLSTAGETATGIMTATVNNNVITNNKVNAAGQNVTAVCILGGKSSYTLSGNTISNNTIENITGTTMVAVLRAYNNVNAAYSETISNNQISKLNLLGTGTAVHTIQGIVTNTAAASIKNIFGNRVDTLQTSAAMVATITGIQNNTGTTVNIYSNKVGYLSSGTGAATILTGILNTSGTAINIYQDSIYNITAANNAATIHGINITGGTTPTIYKNNISSLSGSGTGAVVCNGISITSTAVTVKIDQNKIFNLAETGAITATPAVNGINIAGAGASPTMTVSNNFISDLKAPSANSTDAIRGIAQMTSLATSTFNVWYNTIYLNATSSGTNFGTTGVYSTTTGVATSATFVFRNNIVVNESVANGTGLNACIRRSASGFINTGIWNNNILWAGSNQTSPRLLFSDGTGGGAQATLLGYQGYSGKEAASLSARPTFVQEATAPYDLHLKPDFNCSFDNVGDNTGIGNNKDIDDDPRNTGTPNNITDIGADEFTATGSGAGVWRGVNTNWLDVNNWCGSIPTTTTDVTIPSGAPFYPIITTNTPVVRNISVNAGGSITVSGVGKLTIYGSITPGGSFDVGDGTLEFAGSVAQTIPAGAFVGDSIKNLIINNATVNLTGSLILTKQLSFTGSNRTFNTNGNLTLRSRMLRTANVADITNNGTNTGNQITGDVTVERYISAKRAWRFLSVPTQNNLQTIKQSWQENQAANAATPAGFGIQITSDRASWSTDGFDLQTLAGGPSMKTYDPVTNTFVGIISTVNVVAPTPNNGRFTTGEGYMTFIRGDRTVNTFPQAATSTVLRSKGALVTGTFGPVSVSAGLFKAIGNPYASAIDFSKLGRTGSVQDAFYVWDPSLGTLGGYVSFAGPFYSPSVVTASYPGANKLIESGSAFFVRAPTTAGTVTITEPCKDANSNLVQRLNDVQPFIRASLYHLPTAGGQVLFDGLWLRFDPAFANGVDNYDVLKMDNSGETVATQIGDQSFAIDSRHNISAEDTIQLKLGHVRAQNYQFEVNTGNNLEQFGVEAFVEDKYLNTKTPVSLSGTTLVPFTVVNEPGSYAADRFRIVFKRLAPVPVSFTQVRADKQQQNVLVSWKVDNEARIDHYEVEESADGLRFSRAANQVATGNNNSSVQYQWLDQQVNRGYNYYRIRSIGQSGESKISETVKVNFTETQPAMIAVYPNPVTEDRQLKVNMVNMATGVYKLNLYNVQGQLIYSSQLNHAGGNSVYTLSLDPMIAKGNYTLDLTTEKNEKSTFKVIVN